MTDLASTPAAQPAQALNLTGWSYFASVEKSGIVLEDIRHDGHPLATTVKLIRTYAEVVSRRGRRFVPIDLGDAGMEVGNTVQIDPGQKPTPDVYYTQQHAAYSPFLVEGVGGCVGQHLSGEQTFVFTAPSDTPRHETSGTAVAGRFYPSLTFEMPPGDSDPDAEAVEALRFDYWIEPNVAPGGRRKTVGANDYVRGLDAKNPQQAGFFRDREYSLGNRLAHTTFKELSVLSAGSQVFSHAEKPLLWEVAADGILAGRTHNLWDNVHIWGASRKGLVSTPGMPYGLHLHWRWAAALTDKTSMLFFGSWMPHFLKAPELAGRAEDNSIVPGGPLIDPRNPETDLRVAVVHRDTALPFSSRRASAPDDFVEIFKAVSPQPKPIESGATIVLIMSIVIYRRDRTKPWAGTVFPHGAFFPHFHEASSLMELSLKLVGAYKPQYLQTKPKRGWYRNPI